MTGAPAPAMLSVAARSGPFAPYLSAAVHAVPSSLKALAPAALQTEKVVLDVKRPLLCRESMSGRSARGDLVAGASLNGASWARRPGGGTGAGRARRAGAGSRARGWTAGGSRRRCSLALFLSPRAPSGRAVRFAASCRQCWAPSCG